MFDERWPDEAEEMAAALDAVLDRHCPSDLLRAAEDDERTSADAGLRRLDAVLADFGIWDLPNQPYLLTRAAVSLGARLAPVPFVSAVPARVVLGQAEVANGVDRSVVPAGLAQTLIVVADDGLGIVATPGDRRRSAGGEAVVVIDGAGDEPVPVDGDVDAVRAWGFLLEAARLVGAAQALIRYGVAYVSDRHQFGVPVGSFQGVSHPLAEAATSVQSADLLVRHAAYLAHADGAVPLFAAVMAAAKARAASRQTAATVHQALGGYGVTVEADCQLYSRRIRAWTAAMPDPGPWLADLARTLADPATRDQVTDLWQFDRGFTLPRWARESR
ncbi:acyl-CoA dehydrogenase family protein [Mycolicibacterium elephantis]|uniref:acyl-CoA dehydrogenase family protein n=1 Tax=Mycolicibacterium elephantis TaxID=81858 RepID=UPI000B2A8666|nr:acyl-CoA dehydrogenase family protein [Mycolicibacterium elephantis]